MDGWVVSTGFGFVSRSMCTLAHVGTFRWGGRILLWEELRTKALSCFGARLVDTACLCA